MELEIDKKEKIVYKGKVTEANIYIYIYVYIYGKREKKVKRCGYIIKERERSKEKKGTTIWLDFKRRGREVKKRKGREREREK
jgi:hypothetical protein